MSNKIALATIQFKADARGANAALESLRQESKTSHEEIDRLNKALQDGIKTMKDANGIEFDVAKRLKEARTEANSFDKAINELIKGATALESVVKNIRLGEIEKSSRAELVGAINAVNARRRSLKEEMPNYDEIKKDLADVENEARKQLNRLDHDTERLLQTLREGGAVAKSVIDEEVDGLNKLLRLIPETDAEWKKYNDQLKEIETHVTNIRKEELKQTAGIIDEKNLGQFSETQIRAAIDATRELMKTVETGGSEYKRFAENIVNAENHLKQYGVEAERARQKEAAADDALKQKEQELSTTMRNRLQSLKALSADALAETKRYWEAQARGADQGTAALKKAEDALKQIDNLERKRKVAALDEILGDPSKHGVAEVRNAVHEFEKLRDSVQKGIPAWQHYNKMVKQGQAYLDNLAKAEAAQRIEAQMRNLSTLSSQGMAEVKKYWEAMVLGAAKGSTELDTYKTKLDQVIAEEKKRSSEAAQQRVGILGGGNLGQYSEAEIRQAIEAGNQLIKTYQTASPEAKALAQNIVRAEEHLKQYGVEAERAAQREAKAVAEATRKRMEADQLMQNQLKQGTALTESALKTQEQYWRKLIDDPKTASASLKQYESNLAEVKRLQEQMAADKGEAALAFFRGDTSNASGSQIEEQAKALKAYRDSLPRQAEAATINEINGYLQQAGVAAEKAAEQTMTLKQALQVSAKAGSGEFKGTTEQLNLARKTLEEMQKGTVKGGYAWRRLQEAITRVDLELKNTGKISKEVEAILDHPKGKSFNELKMAIEQGRLALQNMRTETQEDQKQFDELSAKIKEADFQLKALGNSSKGTASAFDKAWSRLKTYVGLYMTAAVAIRKLVSTMGDLMELSDRMGEVRKTTGFTADEVGHLSDNLAKLDTRTPIHELLGLSAAAGQLGLKAEEDVRGFTEAANMLMVALPEMGREGATEMLKVALATGEIDRIRQQMHDGLVEGSSATAVAMTKIGSTIDQLRANSAAAAPAITDFVKRVGAVGAQSGITIDQVAALGSTVDALGMRVEMSATALSRMIPAIRNNAFELAKAIGVTPDAIRNLFNTGRGMEAILMILQHIKDSNLDAESIEAMMGMGGMADVMKDLNQQGARAGIVFAGLSQNVDELRRQLGVARTAYEENIAIQNEYNKMNDTTAAKWARLKNQVEEAFVSDRAQRDLGLIIDKLRGLVDFLTGEKGISKLVRMLGLFFLTFKLGIGDAVSTGIKNIYKLKAAFTNLGKTIISLSGLWNALASVAIIGIVKLIEATSRVDEASSELGKLGEELQKEKKAVDKLFFSLAKYQEQERLAAIHAKEQAEAEAKKAESIQGASEATEDYIKKFSIVEKLEQKRAETEEFLSKAIKKRNETTDEAIETAQALAEADERVNKQSTIITLLEEQRANLADFFAQKMRKSAEAIEDAAEVEKEYTFNGVELLEVEESLAKQVSLINMLEEQHAGLMEILNQKQLKEVVIVGKRLNAEESLAQQSDLIRMLEEKRVETENFLMNALKRKTIAAEESAEADTLAAQSIKDVISAEKEYTFNGVELLEVEESLSGQISLINMLEEQHAGLLEILNQRHLEEVVIIGKRLNAEKKQSEFVQSLERQRAETEEFLANALKRRAEATEESAESEEEAANATQGLSKEYKETAEQSEKAEEGIDKVRVAGGKSAAVIREINSKYSDYLGYMLSETASAQQLASARELINAKLRETITLKAKEQAMGGLEQEYGQKINKKAANIEETVKKIFGDDYDAAARVSIGISEAAERYANDAKSFNEAVDKIVNENRQFISKDWEKKLRAASSQGGWYLNEHDIARSAASIITVKAEDYRKAIENLQEQEKVVENRFTARMKIAQEDTKKRAEDNLGAINDDWKKMLDDYQKADGKEKERLAAEVYKLQRSYESEFNKFSDYFTAEDIKAIEENINGMKTYENELRKIGGEAIRAYDAMLHANGIISGVKPTTPNPWGDKPPAENTEYAEWTIEQLVNRRKMMRDFRNAIKTDTDVKAVLAEDAALMAAFKDKNADMRSVIEWYNTERLKIQNELRGRYSTNTGDWLDAGGSKRGRKFDESTYVLAELERYYALRKERIEDARIEEGLTEAEYNRRIEALEQEHLQKRSDLRKTFTEKDDKAFVKQFRQWWADIEELDEIRWDKVDKEWSEATDRSIRFNDMNAQKDLAKMKGVIMKQMNEIANIISKERPFDGITKNLEDNLTKMSILFTDKERTDRQLFGVEDFVRQRTERLQFLLKEAEHAYSIGSEELLGRMREAGLNNWADAIASDENADAMKQALMAQLRAAYDAVQEAIKKEATLIKKQVEIQWNDTVLTNGQSMKQAFEGILSSLGLQEDRVNRANSLVGGGTFSERVADRLAIKQMQVRLQMQETYYAMLEKIGKERIEQLEKAGKLEDALHVRKSLDLALSEEQKKKDEQRVAIANRLEESQNRLYKELREWSELLASSLQGVFEATNAGNAEYYNELAKLSLTGKGGPGAGTYVVIDNAGTSEAKAHYEYLSERDALERQHEIERQNAVADAWKKVMDDINEKMSESITDQLNAMMQNSALTDNTTSVEANTLALGALTGQLAQGLNVNITTRSGGSPAQPPQNTSAQGGTVSPVFLPGNESGFVTEWQQGADAAVASAEVQTAAARKVDEALQRQFRSTVTTTTNANKEIEASTHSMFASMTQAANLYGIAYQAMCNDNLSATQKFGMVALQATGNAAISGLQVAMAQAQTEAVSASPGVLGMLWKTLGPVGGSAMFAVFSGLIGGLMGLLSSRLTKSKSEIVQATGASNNAGRLATGMLTYAEGNVNEFTDPRTLTTGRRYNVQAADGKTYRARYMGRNPRTHLTNGPEFHLVGEKGREAIIDAQTTRQITMDDNGIWQAIQTLYNGGRMRRTSIRRARGVASFADGNIESFDDFDGGLSPNGSPMDMAAIMSALDRSSAIQEALLERLSQPFEAFVSPYGKKGIVHGYDHYKKEAKRYGQEYID